MRYSVVGVALLLTGSFAHRAEAQAPSPAPAADPPPPSTPMTTGDAIAPRPRVLPALPAAPARPAPAPPRPIVFPARHGLTLEASLGVTQLRTVAPGGENEHGFGPGFALGAGWWLSDRLAVELRFSLGRYEDDSYGFTYEDSSTLQLFAGVGAQVWLQERLWLGAALGGGQSFVDSTLDVGFPLNTKGPGIELRGGFAVLGSRCHQLNLQLDVSALSIDASGDRDDFIATSVAFLLGYQYL